MSKLEELINKLCPDGVECIKLGDITTVLRGKRLTKSQLSETGKYAVYHGGLEPLGNYDKFNRVANTVMIINVGASAGTIGYCDTDFWSSDGCYCLEPTDFVNSKFLYYFLSNNEQYFQSKVRRAGIPTLDAFVIEQYVIPLPPLPVQEEIVRILDNMTSLTAELTDKLAEEKAARQKQYEYYRDSLLSFEGNTKGSVEFITLSELFNTKNGYTPSKSNEEYWTNGTIPWFRMEDIRANGRILTDSLQHVSQSAVKGTLFPKNSIIIATSATIGEHALVKVDFLANQRFTVLMLKKQYKKMFDVKFLYYYCFKLDRYCLTCLNQSSFASVDMVKFTNFKFPIIPLEEQQRIVNILERFDKLCNDISEGLPAEIEARKKQYEYYRDKLLTFKEKEA